MLTPPSPSTSPSLSPSDITNNRKRQRSHSMDSGASSSSPKRAVSLDPNHDVHDTPRPKDMSTLHIADGSQIDAYMEEQGESLVSEIRLDVPPSSSTPSSHATPALATGPSLASKLETITNLRKSPMRADETWYVVSRKWYRRWEKACSGEEDKEGRVEESDLGPVNNVDILNTDGSLVQCTEGVDVEFIPEEAWKLLEQWYVIRSLGGHTCPSVFVALIPAITSVSRILYFFI